MLKIADFMDEIEIDKIRNTAEIFHFFAKFVFLWTLENFLYKLYGKNSFKRAFFGSYRFFLVNYIYRIFLLFHGSRSNIGVK